jgi:hypothetical protein
MIVKNTDRFLLIEEGRLLRKVREGMIVPYIELIFHGDGMGQMHSQFGQLSHPSFASALETRIWWPIMDADIPRFIAMCPNYPLVQRARSQKERELPQFMIDPFIQPFQHWGIDLSGILPKTTRGYRWIATTIDYAPGWPIAKAIANATEDVIANFIFHEIYMYFDTLQEIFIDWGSNISLGQSWWDLSQEDSDCS